MQYAKENAMGNFDLYQDISRRCGGSLYVGVVGPVRTGKSTLIQRFLEDLVLPGIDDADEQKRVRDSMPQSADGKTVMTTEPKFIPEKPVKVAFTDKASANMRFVDCVGYLIEGAAGTEENGEPRMVNTPWKTKPMPFAQAAELGTKKVFGEHANVGFVVTTDGTIADLARENYIEAEERIIAEMKASGKPFLILINSAKPESNSSRALCEELQKKYDHPTVLLDALHLSREDLKKLLELLLAEFPAKEINVKLPHWVMCLNEEHPLKQDLIALLRESARKNCALRGVAAAFAVTDERIKEIRLKRLDYATGLAELELTPTEESFYQVLSDTCGVPVRGDDELMETLTELAAIREKYLRIEEALNDVERTGYGIVTPKIEEMTLEEPEIVKQSGAFGVKLKASCPSIHMIRTNLETQISPIVGNEKQSKDMIDYLGRGKEEDPSKIWDTEVFGKTLRELVGEGLENKLTHIPEDARKQLCEALTKIVNEGCSNLICVLI